jgi:hypothetical protein
MPPTPRDHTLTPRYQRNPTDKARSVERDDLLELIDDRRLRGWTSIDPSTAQRKEGARAPLPPSSSASRVVPEVDFGDGQARGWGLQRLGFGTPESPERSDPRGKRI